MAEKLYCYLCGMEDPEENSPLCGDCKDHMPADTQLEDWLDPTVVAAFLKEDTKPTVISGGTGGTTNTKTNNSKTTKASTGGYDAWNGYSSGGTYRKPCPHPGTQPIFSIGKRDFCAANSGGITTGEKYADAVIDCAGVATRTKGLFVDGTDKYKALNDLGERDLIRLHWTDMGVPPVGRAFWRKLLRMLPEGRIVACCIGGHGRTGTCLASLLVANDRMCADQAIDFIRENHCDRAIETLGQESYIRSLQTDRQAELNDEYLAQFEPVEDDDDATPEEGTLMNSEPCPFCDDDDPDGECPVCAGVTDVGDKEGPCEFCNGDPCNLSTTGCFVANCCEECGLLDCPEVCPNFERGNFRVIKGFQRDEEE